MTHCADVQNKGNNTLYINVNNMTGVGLEQTPPKCMVSYTSALDHSAILRVCCVVNSMDDDRRYHVQVFKVKETILCIGTSTK